MQPRQSAWRGISIPAILALGFTAAFGQQIVIDFEAQCPRGVQSSGPCSTNYVDEGNGQILNVTTSLGVVQLQGGGLFDDATNLPADETAVYSTFSTTAFQASPPVGAGYQNPITITFPSPVTNFYMTLLNGQTYTETYTVADNAGHSSSFSVPANTSSGIQGIGFTSAGTVITISTPDPNWDFTIDNISFSPLPANPVLSTTPNVLSFAGQPQSGNTQSGQTWQQSIVVQNQGSGTLSFNASVVSGSSWLSISPASGSAVLGVPVAVAITVNPQGLAPGSYRDVVHITSPSGTPQDVPVSLFVANSGPILSASPLGVTFYEVQGAGSSATQTITVTNNGTTGSNVAWQAGPGTGPGIPNADFLLFGETSGVSQPGSPSSLTLSLNTHASTLAPGVYYELVTLTDQNSQDSPQYVTVVLNVVPASTGAQPQLLPAGLVFTGPVGQKVLPQQFAVNWSSAQANFFTTAALTPPGQAWLRVDPATGTSSTSSPALMTVEVNTTGLQAGVYTGTVAVVYSGTVVGAVNVTLILGVNTGAPDVTGVARATPLYRSGVRPEAAVQGCAPSALVLTETGLPSSFTVPAGWPATLATIMSDDCGNAIEGGAVAASFSNGDAPLSLSDQGSGGQYVAAWQPSNLSNTTISLYGTAPGGLKPASARLSGVVTPNKSPVLNPGGILNNFSYLVGGPLAPGTVSAGFGSGLSTLTNGLQTGVTPLPTQFQNTQLVVAGFLAPLYYVSLTQLNVEIPAELRTLQQYEAVGVVNGALTLPVPITIVPAAPGVLEDLTSDHMLIAQHGDFTLVNAASPAHPGEALVMYLVGMGGTNPGVASGQVAPGLKATDTLASALVQPVVKVNNQTAQILFAGLTPGYVGLYQINFVVPSTATAGSLSVSVSQGTTNANPTTLLVAVP